MGMQFSICLQLHEKKEKARLKKHLLLSSPAFAFSSVQIQHQMGNRSTEKNFTWTNMFLVAHLFVSF
jgi:hypothetical protein